MSRQNPNRFLVGSFVALTIITFGAFFLLSHFMESCSGDTISQVGKVYMQNLSEQIAMHFQTTINLRLDQVESMVENVRPGVERERETTREEVMDELRASQSGGEPA